MKLFLDDTREFPKSGYECVRDAASAKLLLSIMEFEFIALDYSLVKGEENGLDVLMWMKENDIFVPHINIHSNHVFGREKNEGVLRTKLPKIQNHNEYVTEITSKGASNTSAFIIFLDFYSFWW